MLESRLRGGHEWIRTKARRPSGDETYLGKGPQLNNDIFQYTRKRYLQETNTDIVTRVAHWDGGEMHYGVG